MCTCWHFTRPKCLFSPWCSLARVAAPTHSSQSDKGMVKRWVIARMASAAPPAFGTVRIKRDCAVTFFSFRYVSQRYKYDARAIGRISISFRPAAHNAECASKTRRIAPRANGNNCSSAACYTFWFLLPIRYMLDAWFARSHYQNTV